MPTLIQRAETFEVNSANLQARALVREMRERIVELERPRPDIDPLYAGLVNRLAAHAYAVERTAQCNYDRQIVDVLREAAEALQPGIVQRFGDVMAQVAKERQA